MQLGFDYQVHPQGWFGLTIGKDDGMRMEGQKTIQTDSLVWSFDVFGGGGLAPYSFRHIINLQHHSWYLSPRYERRFLKDRISFFAGPSIDFHTLKTNGASKADERKKQQVTLGALGGVSFYPWRRFLIYAAFKLMPPLHFEEQTAMFETGTETLPGIDKSFSAFRIGVGYEFEWGSGK